MSPPSYSRCLLPSEVPAWSGNVIQRGIFVSVPDLVYRIKTYIRLYNRNAQPFRWTYRNPKRRIRVSLSSETRHLVMRSVEFSRAPPGSPPAGRPSPSAPGLGWRELVLCCNVLYPKWLPHHCGGLKLNRIEMGGTGLAFPVASLPVAFTV